MGIGYDRGFLGHLDGLRKVVALVSVSVSLKVCSEQDLNPFILIFTLKLVVF